MDRRVRALWITVLVPALLHGASPQNLDDRRVALSGYDPVSYFESTGPLKGDPYVSLEHDDAIYYFVTEENRGKFEKTPEKYTPAAGGWCAWAMLEGDKVDVDPETYKIADGKLLLFYNGFWGDTRKKWNRRAMEVPEADLIRAAEENWTKLSGKQED